MTLEAALSALTRASFVLISLLLLLEYRRYRDAVRRDALLVFATFAVAILIGEALRLSHTTNRWASVVSAVAIMSQPYLLLRLARWFRPVPRPVLVGALAGLALCAAVLATMPPPLPAGPTMLLVAYFAAVEAYAAAQLIRGALRSSGVAHRRLVLVGQASALLVGVILLAGVAAAFPGFRASVRPLSSALALGCVLLYFLGFTPPARLRRSWQLAELYRFLRAVAARSAAERSRTILMDLCETATRLTGARGSVAAVTRSEGAPQAIAAGDVPGTWSGAVLETDGLTGEVPAGETGGVIRHIADQLQTPWVSVVPITSGERAWGTLVTFLGQPPLFPEDDRELLRLIGEQCALVLDHGRLLDELSLSARRLETANKELEAFSYSVSHDLRAPLRAIDGFTRILMEEALSDASPAARAYLQKVRDNARQMGALIDDLLAFARLSRQPLRRRQVATEEVVEEALEALRHEREGRPVRITVGELPPCDADPALLKQVYVNLLSNALKFTRTVPAPHIQVGAERQDGKTVYFVRDNGVGFDMAYAHKLFGVFQRLHRPEEYEGTGVGLAIVQRVVHRHGGRAWGVGELGRGATFYFTLGGSGDDSREAR